MRLRQSPEKTLVTIRPKEVRRLACISNRFSYKEGWIVEVIFLIFCNSCEKVKIVFSLFLYLMKKYLSLLVGCTLAFALVGFSPLPVHAEENADGSAMSSDDKKPGMHMKHTIKQGKKIAQKTKKQMKNKKRKNAFLQRCEDSGKSEDKCMAKLETAKGEIKAIRKKKRKAFVGMIVSSKLNCIKQHGKENRGEIRKCFRQAVKTGIVDLIMKKREYKKQCKEDPDNVGAVYLACVGKKEALAINHADDDSDDGDDDNKEEEDSEDGDNDDDDSDDSDGDSDDDDSDDDSSDDDSDDSDSDSDDDDSGDSDGDSDDDGDDSSEGEDSDDASDDSSSDDDDSTGGDDSDDEDDDSDSEEEEGDTDETQE